MSNRTILNAIR